MLMEKFSRAMSVMSVVCMELPAVTEARSDEDAEDDNNADQEAK
jgi:hypothetical protein